MRGAVRCVYAMKPHVAPCLVLELLEVFAVSHAAWMELVKLLWSPLVE
jgi:hypothetical protein